MGALEKCLDAGTGSRRMARHFPVAKSGGIKPVRQIIGKKSENKRRTKTSDEKGYAAPPEREDV